MSDKTKDSRITFRLTDAEAERLADLARAEGVKPSAFIRRAIARLLRRKAA